MKVCVLGAGSLGSAIGGALALTGNEVHLVARPSHVAAVNERGLTMVAGDEERVSPVAGHETAQGVGICDLVIVLCKAMDTAALAAQAHDAGIVGPDTVVMSLQNGMGCDELLIDAFGAEHVVGGKTYIGGMLLEPGKVQANIAGKRTVIGELDGNITGRVQAIAAMFNEAGMECAVSDNIKGVIWNKLLVNVATGAVCAITGLPYEGIYSEPLVRETGLAAVREGMAVAAALGIQTAYDSPEGPWELAREGLPGNFKPSLLQSLEKGRKTEVDFIAGSVVREGEKVGIPTPVNRTLVAMVHGIERRIGAK